MKTLLVIHGFGQPIAVEESASEIRQAIDRVDAKGWLPLTLDEMSAAGFGCGRELRVRKDAIVGTVGGEDLPEPANPPEHHPV